MLNNRSKIFATKDKNNRRFLVLEDLIGLDILKNHNKNDRNETNPEEAPEAPNNIRGGSHRVPLELTASNGGPSKLRQAVHPKGPPSTFVQEKLWLREWSARIVKELFFKSRVGGSIESWVKCK